MKNLLIYINPAKDFSGKLDDESKLLVKIQIDNSLDLGWKREDICLVTNFDYEYNGVKSLVIDDNNYCEFSPTASKINAIINLFELGHIGNDLYWFHDLDAFQLEDITEDEIDRELNGADFGLTDYGRTVMNSMRDKRWSTGSIFFNKESEDIFRILRTEVYRYKANEEICLLELLKKKRNQPLKKRIKRLNITYNLATRKRDIKACYELAKKPLKVIHFHPFDKRSLNKESGRNNMEVCVYGKNRLNRVLITNTLKKWFDYHGITNK